MEVVYYWYVLPITCILVGVIRVGFFQISIKIKNVELVTQKKLEKYTFRVLTNAIPKYGVILKGFWA